MDSGGRLAQVTPIGHRGPGVVASPLRLLRDPGRGSDRLLYDLTPPARVPFMFMPLMFKNIGALAIINTSRGRGTSDRRGDPGRIDSQELEHTIGTGCGSEHLP